MSAAESLNSLRLQQALASCSQSIANGDIKQSEESISELVHFLDSVSDFISSGTKDEEESESTAFEVLSEIYDYLISPSLDQAITDALAYELPKSVSKFACVSTRCFENAERIINHLVEICNPRDMVSILCEAMTTPSENFNNSLYFTPLLGALAKVFEALKRRSFEQVKVSLPVVLKVLEVILTDPEDEQDTAFMDFLNKAILIANSIKQICIKLDQKDEKLIALFGLYVLQITVLISNSVGSETSRWSPIMLQLSDFLHYCGFTYLGLITGHEVNTAIDLISQGDEDYYTSCFSHVKCGAAIIVVWRDVCDEGSKEDLDEVKVKLCKSQTKRWEAVGILKHVFASYNLPWVLKRHAVDFLYCIMEGIDFDSHKDYDESLDYSVYMPSLYAALQGIQMVMVYASDSLLRKKAFETFKMVVADVPGCLRFDILMALIKNSELSSMIAILLGCVKEEMLKEYPKKQNKVPQSTLSFWTVSALDCVEFVLKPPKGGPPSLPEFTDAVLSALNLYRFILITESSGKTNYTQVLSKNKLEKVYKEWLEPLRKLISVVANADNDELATCALNPLEFVLYRCIELVEENLKHTTT